MASFLHHDHSVSTSSVGSLIPSGVAVTEREHVLFALALTWWGTLRNSRRTLTATDGADHHTYVVVATTCNGLVGSLSRINALENFELQDVQPVVAALDFGGVLVGGGGQTRAFVSRLVHVWGEGFKALTTA